MRRISAVSLSPPLCEALPPPRRRDSRRAARSLRSFSCRAVIASEPDAVCSRAATPRRAGHSGRAAAMSGFSHAASARGAKARRERTGAAAGSARARAQAQGRRPTARHRARLTSPHARHHARGARRARTRVGAPPARDEERLARYRRPPDAGLGVRGGRRAPARDEAAVGRVVHHLGRSAHRGCPQAARGGPASGGSGGRCVCVWGGVRRRGRTPPRALWRGGGGGTP